MAPEPAALSKDAFMVRELHRELARAGFQGDAFGSVHRVYPEWTRARWDHAVAELATAQQGWQRANARNCLVIARALGTTWAASRRRRLTGMRVARQQAGLPRLVSTWLCSSSLSRRPACPSAAFPWRWPSSAAWTMRRQTPGCMLPGHGGVAVWYFPIRCRTDVWSTSMCNGLQWKWLRTAINGNLGPDYLHLSIPWVLTR